MMYPVGLIPPLPLPSRKMLQMLMAMAVVTTFLLTFHFVESNKDHVHQLAASTRERELYEQNTMSRLCSSDRDGQGVSPSCAWNAKKWNWNASLFGGVVYPGDSEFTRNETLIYIRLQWMIFAQVNQTRMTTSSLGVGWFTHGFDPSTTAAFRWPWRQHLAGIHDRCLAAEWRATNWRQCDSFISSGESTKLMFDRRFDPNHLTSTYVATLMRLSVLLDDVIHVLGVGYVHLSLDGITELELVRFADELEMVVGRHRLNYGASEHIESLELTKYRPERLSELLIRSSAEIPFRASRLGSVTTMSVSVEDSVQDWWIDVFYNSPATTQVSKRNDVEELEKEMLECGVLAGLGIFMICAGLCITHRSSRIVLGGGGLLLLWIAFTVGLYAGVTWESVQSVSRAFPWRSAPDATHGCSTCALNCVAKTLPTPVQNVWIEPGLATKGNEQFLANFMTHDWSAWTLAHGTLRVMSPPTSSADGGSGLSLVTCKDDTHHIEVHHDFAATADQLHIIEHLLVTLEMLRRVEQYNGVAVVLGGEKMMNDEAWQLVDLYSHRLRAACRHAEFMYVTENWSTDRRLGLSSSSLLTIAHGKVSQDPFAGKRRLHGVRRDLPVHGVMMDLPVHRLWNSSSCEDDVACLWGAVALTIFIVLVVVYFLVVLVRYVSGEEVHEKPMVESGMSKEEIPSNRNDGDLSEKKKMKKKMKKEMMKESDVGETPSNPPKDFEEKNSIMTGTTEDVKRGTTAMCVAESSVAATPSLITT